MRTALSHFHSELDAVVSHLDLIDALAELRSQPIAASIRHTRVGRSSERVRLATIAASRWEIIALDGLVLYLSAAFEECVRALVQALARDLGTQAVTYSQLDAEVRRENIQGIGEYFRRSDDPRWNHLNVTVVVNELAAAINNGSPFQLFGEGLALHYNNLRPDELVKMFRRLGVRELWNKLGDHSGLQGYLSTTQRDITVRAARLKLEAFIADRNAIVHRSSSYQSVGSSLAREYADFLRILSGALADILAQWFATR